MKALALMLDTTTLASVPPSADRTALEHLARQRADQGDMEV